MFNLLANPYIIGALALLVLVLVSVVLNVFYANKHKNKINEYKHEISRSHLLLLKLEVRSEELKNRLNQLEEYNQLQKTA